jgi:putative endopeptidase
MRGMKWICTALLVSATAMAQATGAANVTNAPKSFDQAAMDPSANPCEDFYQYSCGGWRKSNPIPSDKARYGRFDELREYNLSVLHSILVDVSKPTYKAPKGVDSAIAKKVGDFYGSCMNEAKVEADGAKPIQSELDRISKIANKQQLIDELAHLHQQGVRAAFGFGISPDLHEASINKAGVSDGGYSLPDRDYYITNTPRMTETREKYVAHVQKMLGLLGEKPEQAQAESKTIMDFETKLADASMDRVLMRDPKNRDHKMSTEDLAKLAPSFDFNRYFVATGSGKFTELNVANPDYMKKFNELVDSTPLDTWKSYLKWRVLRSRASLLSKPFVDESFAFNGAYMSGQKEIEARWKRCASLTDASLGEALGPLYVAKAFPPAAKKRMDELVAEIEKSMNADIKQLEWMSPETQVSAQAKLDKISNKIGYPTKWKDYSTVKVNRNDLIGNVQSATWFEVKRNLDKLGKQVDKTEWSMTPPTVNAYYSPSLNNINFPAGILQPPFFSDAIDDAVNFGAIGVVIGHELTHGFDDQGRKFDGDGNLRDWWGPKDGPEFERRAQCLVDEYSSFSPVEGTNLKGKLVLGENTADNGGLKLAYMALMRELGDDAAKAEPAKKDGFTPQQRLFIGFAQVWCENVTDQRARELALTDPHSPGKFRVIGTIRNSPQFREAFKCKTGDAMAPANACSVW